MPAGTYDNPLADFLDAIPGYVNQYQQNQLQSQRYKDEKEYRAARDEVTDKQKKLTNELNLILHLFCHS